MLTKVRVKVVFVYKLTELLIGLLFHHVAATLARCYKTDAEEYEQYGYGMGDFEYAEACKDTDDDRHHWLDIVIYADYRRTEYLLGLHGEYVADEGADYYNESGFEPCLCRNLCKWNCSHMRESEWGDDDGGKGEHPFVDGEHRVALDELVEH